MAGDATLRICRANPASAGCRALIEELDRLQAALYPAEDNYLDSIEELQQPTCDFLAAYIGARIVGCGALKTMDEVYGELKRMYVVPDLRQHGVGQRLLQELEAHSVRRGIRLIRLETGVRQPGALALYRRNGYKEIEAFGDYTDSAASIFMEKRL